MPWADIVLFAVIGGIIALWWTHPPATVSVAQSDTVTPTVAPTPDLSWLVQSTAQPGGVAAVFAPTPTSTPLPPTATALPTPIQHKIASGESVGLIAEKYGVKVKDLMALNNMTNDWIYPGQTLLIPPSGLPVPPTPTATPTGGTLIYTVKEGDTIFGMAVEFHTDVDLILAANNRKLDDFLGVGDHLLIPLSPNTPVPTPTTTGTAPPPTFTPQAGFRSPALLTPPDNSIVPPDSPVLLTWTSVGLLSEDEWYLVLLRSAGSSGTPAVFWTRATSWRLEPPARPPSAPPIHYTWQVQVVRGNPDQRGSHPSPLGGPSAPRSFTW